MESLRLNPADNIAIVLSSDFGGIPRGHKIALVDIGEGESILKYGQVIAIATSAISKGEHVHVHNVKNPSKSESRPFAAKSLNDPHAASERHSFQGYLRADGTVGIRNYIAVAATVNCSATVVKAICRKFEGQLKRDDIDGVVPLAHSQGCAQTLGGAGHSTLNKTIAGWMLNPNVVGTVVIGLGCEGTTYASLKPYLGDFKKPLLQLRIQDVGGTANAIREGVAKVEELLASLPRFDRSTCPLGSIKLALNCGGSDGFSAITANPALGVTSDLLVAEGGSVVLAEIPESQGADDLLRARATTEVVSAKVTETFAWWENYVQDHKVDFNNNLAPGNIAGGISTITEKSLGAMSKAGSTSLTDVIGYSVMVKQSGFNLMNTPGFDPVSVTGLVAGGCQIVCFTTGRGSVYGSSISPTIKIATNSELARKMADDIDFNAGRAVEGTSIETLGAELFELLLQVAEGAKTKSEILGMGWEEFTPWAIGETL